MYILSHGNGVEEYDTLEEALEAFPAEEWEWDGDEYLVEKNGYAVILMIEDLEGILLQ